MLLYVIIYLNKIDNDLSISGNVSSNKMIHAILALVFLTKHQISLIASLNQLHKVAWSSPMLSAD